MNYPFCMGGWTVALPAQANGEIYDTSETAIEIVSVNCDGENVKPESNYVVGAPRLGKISFKGSVIYSLNGMVLTSWDDTAEVLKYMRCIKTYGIPYDTRIIDLVYRVRYPDGRKSGEVRMTLIASMDGEWRLTNTPVPAAVPSFDITSRS
jgi:hypothetical protein